MQTIPAFYRRRTIVPRFCLAGGIIAKYQRVRSLGFYPGLIFLRLAGGGGFTVIYWWPVMRINDYWLNFQFRYSWNKLIMSSFATNLKQDGLALTDTPTGSGFKQSSLTVRLFFPSFLFQYFRNNHSLGLAGGSRASLKAGKLADGGLPEKQARLSQYSIFKSFVLATNGFNQQPIGRLKPLAGCGDFLTLRGDLRKWSLSDRLFFQTIHLHCTAPNNNWDEAPLWRRKGRELGDGSEPESGVKPETLPVKVVSAVNPLEKVGGWGDFSETIVSSGHGASLHATHFSAGYAAKNR